MLVLTHKRFDKQFVRLPNKIKNNYFERVDILRKDSRHPLLDIHPLHSPFEGGSLSINITGNYRAIFIQKDRDTILFTHIGTHHQLFGT